MARIATDMRRTLLLFGLIALAVPAALLACGTWVAQEEVELRHGVEYAVIHWSWQWYPRETLVHALHVCGGVGLLVIAAVAVRWLRSSKAMSPVAGRVPSSVEQRRSSRIACRWPVRYQIRSLPFERHASCVNISSTGMQCLMRERWFCSTPLELRLSPPERSPMALSGLVVWAKAAPEAVGQPCHRIGIRFNSQVPHEQMVDLVRQLAVGGGPAEGASSSAMVSGWRVA